MYVRVCMYVYMYVCVCIVLYEAMHRFLTFNFRDFSVYVSRTFLVVRDFETKLMRDDEIHKGESNWQNS
jgi:hypothetical protein